MQEIALGLSGVSEDIYLEDFRTIEAVDKAARTVLGVTHRLTFDLAREQDGFVAALETGPAIAWTVLRRRDWQVRLNIYSEAGRNMMPLMRPLAEALSTTLMIDIGRDFADDRALVVAPGRAPVAARAILQETADENADPDVSVIIA